MDFSIEDISNLSDSNFDSNEINEEIKSNESLFSKFILDIKDTLTEKKIKDNFSESVMSFFKNPEIPKSSVIAKIDHFKEPSAKKDVPRWFSNSNSVYLSLV